jgi:uncharacterized protein
MKKVTLLAVFIVAAVLLVGCTPTSNTPPTEVVLPAANDYILDNSNVLSEAAKNGLHQKLKEFDQTAQIAVVTVPTTQPLNEEEYAIKLAEKWKVGHAGIDNGVIFLIVTGDRRLRIEVGRGLEDKITDADAGRILDSAVVPELKKNNWEAGIINGVDAIIKEIK